ncbi:MAG TPA: MFS transporter [Candidatus Methylomirabilis sp.]|nr:MFS transporter [Candidatus Methylomirabilis sp.]
MTGRETAAAGTAAALTRQRRSRDVLTRPLLTCFAIASLVHAVTYLLNAVLPLHVAALGGSKTQIGMLFSVSTAVSMVLRPLVGGWNDRYGFRRVVVPGVAALLLTSTALHWASTPAAAIALMVGLGLANGLISTSAGVLVARATPPAQRGEALSIYYVATSLGFAVGPPLGLALYAAGGPRVDFLVAVALSAVVGALTLSLTDPVALAISDVRPGWRVYSRHALPMSGALVLTNLGNSAVYAFLPLYAMASGMKGNVGWFYALFSGGLIACRLVLRGMSDRVGRFRVVVAAMALIAVSYLALALPPSAASLATAALLLAGGAGLLYPTLVALLVDRTPEPERGLAIGTLSASFDVGIVVGSLLIGFAVEHTSYALGYALAGGLAAVGLATFVATERARARVVSRPAPGVSS